VNYRCDFVSKPFSDQPVQINVVKSDIQQVLDLFSVMQNIQMHGVVGEDVPLEWVSVEQIYREMPHPKMTKDKLRYFCEYQYDIGNLEKRTGKEKDTRQAKAEYSVSIEGKNSLEKFLSIAQNVFPTIKKALKEYSDGKLDWENTYDKLDGKYKFDISLKTDDGLFLLKYYSDGVKFEDVEKIVDIAIKYYRGSDKEVLRFVCLSKKFDDIFFSDELNNKMEQLNPSKPIVFKTFLSKGRSVKWINLDLILERENGYTMIWIDK